MPGNLPVTGGGGGGGGGMATLGLIVPNITDSMIESKAQFRCCASAVPNLIN